MQLKGHRSWKYISTAASLLAVFLPLSTAKATLWLDLPEGTVTAARDEPLSQAPTVRVEWHDDTGLEVETVLHGLDLEEVSTEGGSFLLVRAPGTALEAKPGDPGLPVIRRLIQVPHGAEIGVRVQETEPLYVDLEAIGCNLPLYPLRGPWSQDPVGGIGIDSMTGERAEPLPFRINTASYGMDQWLSGPRAEVRELALYRGRRLCVLEIRPVAYHPVRGQLAVWNRMGVEIQFPGGAPLRALRKRDAVNPMVLNPNYRVAPTRTAGNILVLTAQIFNDSTPVNQFIVAKEAQGFNVTTHAFPAGTEITTAREFITGLWGTPDQPDYIVIFGDANGWAVSFEDEWFPAIQSSGTRIAYTDILYACVDGEEDWFPDVPIGRIPARDIPSLEAIMDKILVVESGDFPDPTYTHRAFFTATADPAADAPAVVDNVIDTYVSPQDIACTRLYAGGPGATTEDLMAAFNDGAFLGSYYGHAGGFQAWGDPLFLFEHVDALENSGSYPFVTAMACSTTAFHYTYETKSPGFMEYMLLAPNKGCCGAWGPSWSLLPYTWQNWADIYTYYYQAVYGDGLRRVGDAANAAAAYFVTLYGPEDPVSEDFTQETILLGDPSLWLPEPITPPLLIVAPTEFAGSAPLNAFIAHKEDLGLTVLLHEVSPGTTKEAIRADIQAQYSSEDGLGYVLLIGDTIGGTVTASTIPHWTGGGDKQADTDWPYVCLDSGDDWYPEIPIGRLSVTSVDSLQDVVSKIITVESGDFPDPDYIKRGVFLASASTEGMAEPSHDYVIENYFTPNQYEGIRLYAAEGAGTQDVIDTVNNGVMWTVYYGHSSSTGWWDPSFGPSDVLSLSNEGMYGIACGWSCNTARYTYDECFGETWLRAPNKGAASFISASNLIYWGSVEAWEPCTAHEQAFFAAIFEDDIWVLGDAWLRGLYRFLEAYGGWDGDPTHPPAEEVADKVRNFFEEFVILGDPSMRIPRHEGFVLEADPTAVDVCSPPETAAEYAIIVSPAGDFSKVVTLSVSGLPSGATASFSEDSGTPPFTSVLTLQNLDQVTPGTYDLTVTGTATSLQESVPLTLSVADDVPEVVVLQNPPDGAMGVSRMPELTWAPAAVAANYTLQVAADTAFTQILYSTTVSAPSATVATELEAGSWFYWRVRAVNGCGTSGYCAPWSFQTIEQADYFTEQFPESTGGFDLDGLSLKLTPDGSGNYYASCVEEAAGLPTDPSGGTAISLGDNDAEQVTLSGVSVPFYGQEYGSFYVGSNGGVTFESPHTAYQESLDYHFAPARISPLFDDLNPSAGGTVSWKQTADCVAVSWEDVPEYYASGSNTFQVEMFFDGAVHITWFGVTCNDAIVGISEGNGIPADFVENDLSASGACGPGPATGGCCFGDVCCIETEVDCLAGDGLYLGDNTACDPNPCVPYYSGCLFISEVVQGKESGDCPRWIEITNAGLTDFVFWEGGLIVQTDGDTDLDIDVDLSGVIIPAGYSLVIVSNCAGTCTGAFPAVYGQEADLYTAVCFGFGNERFVLTDTADSSNLLDIYGEFGVDGTGEIWEFTDGYSYRLMHVNCGAGLSFDPSEWYFGGVGSLGGDSPTQSLLDYTTPGVHDYEDICYIRGDMDNDGDVDLADYGMFCNCLAGPGEELPPGDCQSLEFQAGDMDDDGDVDMKDCKVFQQNLPAW